MIFSAIVILNYKCATYKLSFSYTYCRWTLFYSEVGTGYFRAESSYRTRPEEVREWRSVDPLWLTGRPGFRFHVLVLPPWRLSSIKGGSTGSFPSGWRRSFPGTAASGRTCTQLLGGNWDPTLTAVTAVQTQPSKNALAICPTWSLSI